MRSSLRAVLRLLALVLVSGAALQLYFVLRIAVMVGIDPQSTTFQRSELWRLVAAQHRLSWAQEWRPYTQVADHLKRAVVASEDANFLEHDGVEWDAIEKAWERNQRALSQAERINQELQQRQTAAAARAERSGRAAPPLPRPRAAQLRGGSTITQQLAKNLFLSGERSLLRKGQEFLITVMLETFLSKQRILEIYLNSVEWGEGVFGAQAAAHYYFGVDAARLGMTQAARLAVMLPAPKRFEKHPGSAYLLNQADALAARMGAVELPAIPVRRL